MDTLIRDEIKKLENGGVSTEYKFVLSERKDSTGRTIPYYRLSQEGVDMVDPEDVTKGYIPHLIMILLVTWLELLNLQSGKYQPTNTY